MYSPAKFAELIGKSVKTLQRWDREKVLVAKRNPKNRRYYTHDQLLEYKGKKSSNDKLTIVYSRVSSNAQKPELVNQISALETFCTARGLAVSRWVDEVGSGLNYKRKKFNKLMIDIENGQVSTLVIAHKDRLVRFGFEWFEAFAQRHGCEIVVMNQESLSPAEEVTQDLLSIIHCFSSRLYGLRKYKTKVKNIVNSKED